ncbi:SDR family oxidoreductase [Bacillus sp. V5-8f]|uniref:SDR family oxidoreductase n=1 Tax=Bacillus sp. V5-8f TaxID=2053044 RepID=UPI0015E0E568|nr:SDR family oxidoreductase [Bacillus sp. V5-8f]
MNYSKIFSLEDKGVIVSGGAGYLGSKIVEGLLDFGAKVVIADMVEEDSLEMLNDKENFNKLFFIKCDLLNTKSVQQMYEKAEQLLGSIDVLFNCAAYTGYGGTGDADQMSDEIWNQGIEGTLGMTFRCIREVIPFMKKNLKGSIINFGSLYAFIAPDFRIYPEGFNSPPNYGAGKAAIVQLTRHCASQFSNFGIRVNSITPGSFPHPETQEHDLFMKNLSDRTMLGRIGYPEDLLGAAILLASDASSYMTGANVTVDGGTTAW